MKYFKLTILATVLCAVLAASPALAQINGAADTSKEGSLLIWPMVRTDSGYETYIFINNNSASDVNLKCFWEVRDNPSDPASTGLFYDFTFKLPAMSPIVFRASDGSSLGDLAGTAGMGNSDRGALKCWAVERTVRRQISWNHLSGFAIVVQGDGMLPEGGTPTTSAWQYSAWRFAANVIAGDGTFADWFTIGWTFDGGDDYNQLALKASPTTVVTPASCPAPYTADYCYLSNAAYDACPKYLSFDFLAEPNGAAKTGGYAVNTLAVVPCKADLTGSTLDNRHSARLHHLE